MRHPASSVQTSPWATFLGRSVGDPVFSLDAELVGGAVGVGGLADDFLTAGEFDEVVDLAGVGGT